MMSKTVPHSVSAMMAAKRAKKAQQQNKKTAAQQKRIIRHGKPDGLAHAQNSLMQKLFCDRMMNEGEMPEQVRDHYIKQMQQAHHDMVAGPLDKALRAFVYLESIMAAFQTTAAIIEKAEPTLKGELSIGQHAIDGVNALIRAIELPADCTEQQRYALMSPVRTFMLFAENYLDSDCVSESLLLKASGYGNAVRLCTHYVAAFKEIRYIPLLKYLIKNGTFPNDALLAGWGLETTDLGWLENHVLRISMALYLCATRTDRFKKLPYNLTAWRDYCTQDWQAVAANNFEFITRAASIAMVTIMDPFENATGLSITDSFTLGVQILDIQAQLRSMPDV